MRARIAGIFPSPLPLTLCPRAGREGCACALPPRSPVNLSLFQEDELFQVDVHALLKRELSVPRLKDQGERPRWRSPSARVDPAPDEHGQYFVYNSSAPKSAPAHVVSSGDKVFFATSARGPSPVGGRRSRGSSPLPPLPLPHKPSSRHASPGCVSAGVMHTFLRGLAWGVTEQPPLPPCPLSPTPFCPLHVHDITA